MPGKSAPQFDKEEKQLQVVFGVAIALVLLGVIAFVVLVIKDMQH